MTGPFLNTPTPNHVPTMLLYGFTQKELAAFRFLMRGFPGIRLFPVAEQDCGLHLNALLEKQPDTSGGDPAAFSRHMLVFAHIPEPIVHPLITICKQATSEKVLKAMLTKTNQNWTSRVLYENLLEEEAQLGG